MVIEKKKTTKNQIAIAEIISFYYQIALILFCYVELLLESSCIGRDYIFQLLQLILVKLYN